MTNNTRLTLIRSLVLMVLALRSEMGYSVGLGPLRLQSALGQPFRAFVQVLGPDAHTLTENCIRSRLTTTDGSEILRPDIILKHVKGANSEINLSSTANLDEPAVTLLIDITCSPTLHRDYQLLLDLRDGLPRVVSTASSNFPERKASLSKNAGSDDGPTELSRSERRKLRKKRTKAAAKKSTSGLDDAESVLPSAEPPIATKTRAKGLPGARNILKLSQEDIGADDPLATRPPPTLKLSDSMSGTDEKAIIGNVDEINAAKARFSAMMRDEDPVLSSQKEIKALQDRLQQNGIDTTLRTDSSKDGPPLRGRTTPGFNKWLIALAVLLMLGVGIVVAVLRPSRRPKEKSVSPWWMAGADTASREVDVVKSAREAARAKRSKAPVEDDDLLDDVPPNPVIGEVALEHYADHFLRKSEPINEPSEAAPSNADPVETVAEETKVRDEVIASKDTLDFSADAFMKDLGDDAGSAADLRRTGLATFELVSDVMQEAEFWKMLNETQRATDILETYCNSDSSDSPVPWLYLFDLYTEINDSVRHAALRERFESKFNGKIPDQDQDPASLHQSLEDYPHLMSQICELWERADVVNFLQGLLINSREDPRQGFDLLVYREILLLIDVAREREKLAA